MKSIILSLILTFCAVRAADTFEHRVVAAVLMGEAWGEGARGMLAVGEVISERARRNGIQPLAVVTAHSRFANAFSCMRGKTPSQLVAKYSREPYFSTALAIARQVVDRPQSLPGITRGATHFTRKGERPLWMRGASRRAEIGKHVFVIPKYVLKSGRV